MAEAGTRGDRDTGSGWSRQGCPSPGWGLELDSAINQSCRAPNEGDVRVQHVCKGCRAAAGEE